MSRFFRFLGCKIFFTDFFNWTTNSWRYRESIKIIKKAIFSVNLEIWNCIIERVYNSTRRFLSIPFFSVYFLPLWCAINLKIAPPLENPLSYLKYCLPVFTTNTAELLWFRCPKIIIQTPWILVCDQIRLLLVVAPL